MDEIASRIEFRIPALRRYAFALIQNHEIADDLVQDCLERALSGPLDHLDEAGLSFYLFKTLRELYVKEAKRLSGLPIQLEEISPSAMDERQEAGLNVQDVLAALDKLPEEQKSLLLLVGVEDFTYEETALILNVPIGTVMSRLSRARQKLRDVLDRSKTVLLRRIK